MSMAGTWVEAEFEAIFREHSERVVRIIRRVLRCDSEAEEVCAEVFLRLYRNGPAATAGGSVGGWLYRTATRAGIDVLRRNQRRGLGESKDSDSGESIATTEDDPLTRLLRSERIVKVRQALGDMKVERAQLLVLRHSGLSYQEVADAMQISAGSVGTSLARAEAEFAKLYQRQERLSKTTPHFETAKEG